MFFDKYKELCRSIGKSPNKVASELGLSSASVTGWKNGNVPRDGTLFLIANYFNVNTEYFYNEDYGAENQPMFWDRYLELCRSVGKSPRKVADELGLAESSVAYWKTGRIPRETTIQEIASYFGVDRSYFFNEKQIKDNESISYPVNGIIAMPVIGCVRAGYGSEAVLDYEDEYVSIPQEQLNGYPINECRLLRVKGDSMYPQICSGDLIVLHLQEEVNSGDVAVLFNGDDEATLKRIKIHEDYIEMIPANPEYMTKRISGTDLRSCRIYGKVLSMIRRF